MERDYLEDQKTCRRMICDKGVDPVWYTAMMRKQRQRELSTTYHEDMEQAFQFVDMVNIVDTLNEDGIFSTDTNTDEIQVTLVML